MLLSSARVDVWARPGVFSTTDNEPPQKRESEYANRCLEEKEISQLLFCTLDSNTHFIRECNTARRRHRFDESALEYAV